MHGMLLGTYYYLHYIISFNMYTHMLTVLTTNDEM